jgi:serine phosphatase RsbU (regulator of sigma subunit)
MIERPDMLSTQTLIETINTPGADWPSADEMERAREVQMRLLRRSVPALETLEYAGCYLPAHSIGGDYYDFIHLGLGRIGIALGDISGKGVPAAIMMASLQALLRSHSANLCHDLARLLRSVNRLFCDCTAEAHFASLFLGEYDDATRTLRYANCGHNPPLIARRNGAVDRLASTATVMGVFRDWHCSVCEVTLEPGDTLLMFTDGVTEAENAYGEEFGEKRLLELVGRRRRLTVAGLVHEAASVLQTYSGGCLRDDATLLIARCMESR